MKQFFGAFLALLMLMPSLACAIPVCVQSLKSSISVEKPCHGHEANQKSGKQKSDDIRFVIDCMGVDLQKADTAHFKKADIRTTSIDLPFIDNAVTSQSLTYSPQVIRGPPLDWISSNQNHPSIILTTQRLRI